MKNNRIAIMGMFTAVALLVTYLEHLLPSPVPSIPGIKLGITNVIILSLLYMEDAKTAWIVNLLRIVLAGLLFTGLTGMIYSLSGGVLSFCVMCIGKRMEVFSTIGVSVLGGCFHNLGQITVAAFLLQNVKLYYYLPTLVLSGVITGVLVGYMARYCIKNLKNRQL